MLSDRVWTQWGHSLRADWEALIAALAHPERVAPRDWPAIQPRLARLAPWDELNHLLQPSPATLAQQLRPLRAAYTHYRRQWLIHRLIFLFLCQGPLLALWLSHDLLLPGLLALPVLGWGWLGLWQYRQAVRGQRPLAAPDGSSA